VAMGYVRESSGVDERYIDEGRFVLDIGGERVPARASLAAPYDPPGVRVKG